MKNDYTFSEWLNQWYKLYKKDCLSEKHQKQYERAFVLHIPESLLNQKLIEVTALEIDLVLYDMGKTQTAKFMYYIYSACLKKAYDLGFIPKDIGRLINPVRHRCRTGKALTNEEITALFKVSKNYRLYYLYKFLLLTGCRRSEALSLIWSDIDYQNEVIHIRGSKTDNADRFLPLTAQLIELFESNPKRNERVFPYNAAYVSKQFKRFCPNHKLHDLRHTFATLCASNGLHPAITQKLLGHSTPEFTLRVYTHVNSADYRNDLENVQRKILK